MIDIKSIPQGINQDEIEYWINVSPIGNNHVLKDLIKSYSDFEQKPNPDDSSSKIIETQVLSPSRILSNLRELLPRQMQISIGLKRMLFSKNHHKTLAQVT